MVKTQFNNVVSKFKEDNNKERYGGRERIVATLVLRAIENLLAREPELNIRLDT